MRRPPQQLLHWTCSLSSFFPLNVGGRFERGGGQPTGRSQEKWEKVEELLFSPESSRRVGVLGLELLKSDKHENLRNTQDGRLLSGRWSDFSSLEVFRGGTFRRACFFSGT